MPTAYHMVHYRRFKSDPSTTKVPAFEAQCRTALGQVDNGSSLWERAADRLFDLGPPDGRKLLLNRVVDLTSAVFGELCLVEDKGMQALLELTTSKVKLSSVTTAQIFNLEERSAPRGSQFVRGMAYWIAIGDHLFFVKSQSMTTDHLSSYLSWLLREKGTGLPNGVAIRFQAELDKSQVAGDIGDVRALRLSGKSVPQLRITAADAPEHDRVVKTSRRVAEKYAIFDQAVEVAELVLGQMRAKSLIDSLGPEEFLSAQTDFKVQGKRTQKSKEAMKNIANELADFTDAKVQVEGKDGVMSNEDAILRTRMPFETESDNSSLLIFENVADQFQVVYQRFVDDAKISAA